MRPLSKLRRVGEDNWKIEYSCNIRGLKCPLMAINREVYGSRIWVSPGCHSLVKLYDHTGVEKPTWSHERLQGVPVHKPHGVSELGRGGKSRDVIIYLIVQVLSTTIQIA